MIKTTITFLFACSVFAAGCQSHHKSKTYDVAGLPKDDSTFLVLRDTAQKKLQIFIDSLDKHGMDYKNYTFLVKSEFIDGENHEHMWSRIYRHSNDVYEGIFIDSAYDVKNIKTGDKVTIYKNAIEDWSIDNKHTGKTTGEFSVKYLQSKLKQDSISH